MLLSNLSSVESRVDNPEFIDSLEETLGAKNKIRIFL